MNVSGVATVWLPVKDVERAVGFYRDVLGMQVENQDGDWAEVTANDLKIGLNASESPSGDGGAVIAFAVDGDIEQAADELRGAGVEVTDGVSEHPWGKVLPFKDLDANDLQLYQPPQG